MRTILRLAVFVLGAAMTTPVHARDALPAGFVFLRDIDPTIVQDIRYATADNFTGRPLPGYANAECVLRREVALALAKVQADLAPQQIGLKVYDCYRPQRATRAMLRWMREPDTGATKRFYPVLDKRNLLSGYVSQYSAHATGTAVDLTLVKLPAAPAAAFDPNARYGDCSGPAAARAPDNSIDMGSGYDCFDLKSHRIASNYSAEAARARSLLWSAMRKRGFHGYAREWWHFSYGPRPAASYDVPIPAR